MLDNARICECQLGLSRFMKDTLPTVVVDATLALAIFDLDFCVRNFLNSLHNLGDQAMRSSSKIVIMLDCKSLRTEIWFSTTMSSFNKPVIGCSSFFLPTLFQAFYLSLSFKIFWFIPGYNNGGPITGGLLSISSILRFFLLMSVSAYKPVLPTVATMSFSRLLGEKIYVTLLASLTAGKVL